MGLAPDTQRETGTVLIPGRRPFLAGTAEERSRGSPWGSSLLLEGFLRPPAPACPVRAGQDREAARPGRRGAADSYSSSGVVTGPPGPEVQLTTAQRQSRLTQLNARREQTPPGTDAKALRAFIDLLCDALSA